MKPRVCRHSTPWNFAPDIPRSIAVDSTMFCTKVLIFSWYFLISWNNIPEKISAIQQLLHCSIKKGPRPWAPTRALSWTYCGPQGGPKPPYPPPPPHLQLAPFNFNPRSTPDNVFGAENLRTKYQSGPNISRRNVSLPLKTTINNNYNGGEHDLVHIFLFAIRFWSGRK